MIHMALGRLITQKYVLTKIRPKGSKCFQITTFQIKARIFIEIKGFPELKYIKILMSAIQIKVSRNTKKQENNKKIHSIKTGTVI